MIRLSAVAMAMALGVPAMAVAHAHLESASPAVGATLDIPPSAVSIRFSEAVEPRFSAIAVTDARNARVDSGTAEVAADDPHRLIVPVARLSPGTYRVVWHATSVDTHKTEGAFTFTVR